MVAVFRTSGYLAVRYAAKQISRIWWRLGAFFPFGRNHVLFPSRTPHQKIADDLPIPILGQSRLRECLVEPRLQLRERSLVERPVEITDPYILAPHLPSDQFVQEPEAKVLVEPPQIGFDLAGSPALPQAATWRPD